MTALSAAMFPTSSVREEVRLLLAESLLADGDQATTRGLGMAAHSPGLMLQRPLSLTRRCWGAEKSMSVKESF